MKPTDRLYIEYGKDRFEGIQVDPIDEPELHAFIEKSKVQMRFSNYSQDKLDHFAKRIYELKKD